MSVIRTNGRHAPRKVYKMTSFQTSSMSLMTGLWRAIWQDMRTLWYRWRHWCSDAWLDVTLHFELGWQKIWCR